MDDVSSHIREYEHLTLVRLLIARKRPTEAFSLLERVRQAAEAGSR